MTRTNEAPHRGLLRRLKALEDGLSRAVDCVLEARNNIDRREWDFAECNLRKLFRDVAAIGRQREITVRQLRLAKKEASST
jgi:hypothetical protein